MTLLVVISIFFTKNYLFLTMGIKYMTKVSAIYESIDDLIAELDEKERNKTLLDKIWTLARYRIPYIIESKWWDLQAFYQRGRTGVANVDWWNLNNYIAHVILYGVTKLIENGNGYPSTMTPEEWHQILVRIKNGVSLAINIDEGCSYPTENEKQQIEEAFTLVGRYFWSLWD